MVANHSSHYTANLFWYKRNKKRGFTSYEGSAIGAVWLAFGVSIFLLSFYFSTHKVSGDSSAVFMMLYAIPTFITGKITKFLPMVYGGIFCWVASLASMFAPLEVDFFLMAACGLFAWLIPGIMLNNLYKKAVQPCLKSLTLYYTHNLGLPLLVY